MKGPDPIEREAAELKRAIAEEEQAFRRQEALPGGKILGVAFSLLVAVVIIFVSYSLVSRTVDYLGMRNWIPASAILIDFKEGRGDRTSTLNVRYRYLQGDRQCTGGRINISRRAGISYADQYRDAYATGKPIAIWTHPDRPCTSVIDRGFPMFDFIFGSLGVIACAGTIHYIRRKSWKLV